MGGRYQAWCHQRRLSAWPPTHSNLAGFLCHYVEENRGSTRSVRNVVSQLRVHARRLAHPWMSEQDSYKVRRTIAALEHHDDRGTPAKRPATLGVLLLVIRRLDLTCPVNRMMRLSLLLGHNGLLRAGEPVSGLQVQDLQWNWRRKEVAIRLSRSKTHRSGPPEEIIYHQYPGICAFLLLRQWLTEWSLWKTPGAYILPKATSESRREATLDFSQPATLS